jgi:hypothetical protein
VPSVLRLVCHGVQDVPVEDGVRREGLEMKEAEQCDEVVQAVLNGSPCEAPASDRCEAHGGFELFGALVADPMGYPLISN